MLVLFALIIPVVFSIAGLVIDIGRALAMKIELNRACMVASEEATKEINMNLAQENGSNIIDEDIGCVIEYYFYENISPSPNYEVSEIDFFISGGNSNPMYLSVSCRASVECIILKIFGIDNIEVSSAGNGRLKGFLK